MPWAFQRFKVPIRFLDVTMNDGNGQPVVRLLGNIKTGIYIVHGVILKIKV